MKIKGTDESSHRQIDSINVDRVNKISFIYSRVVQTRENVGAISSDVKPVSIIPSDYK